MVENRITVDAFDSVRFESALVAASTQGPRPKGQNTPTAEQINYLARYCELLGAKTIVTEEHYVDRHYLDEYALYYARSLQPPPSNSVQRFHVFDREFGDDDLTTILEACAGADRDAVRRIEDDWSSDYCGFISIRPLAAVPVGRTVLRQLDDGQPRDIRTTGTHTVHLANLALRVDGLAFQQQDMAVGACATAALWSALSRVARQEHMRAPTPAEVSECAGRHLLANGRTLPAVRGLSVQQLSEAIRACGFAPEAARADDGQVELFVVGLHTYLRSGIPVVLTLISAKGAHAVAVAGFRLASTANPLLLTTLPARSARVDKLYIHDDRLGPYAKATITSLPEIKDEGIRESLILEIELPPDDDDPDAGPVIEPWIVDSALAPVYPKLRLPVRSLVALGDRMAGLVEEIVGTEALELEVEFFFQRSGTYLSELNGQLVPGCGPFLRRIALSRWCGVVRWHLNDKPLLDFVYDTTDIVRDEEDDGGALLRGVVCLNQKFQSGVADIARAFAVPTT